MHVQFPDAGPSVFVEYPDSETETMLEPGISWQLILAKNSGKILTVLKEISIEHSALFPALGYGSYELKSWR